VTSQVAEHQFPLQAARPVVKQPTVVEKPCSKCHVLKPAAEFFRREQSHDGLQSWCRACKNAARQAQEPRPPTAGGVASSLPPTALPAAHVPLPGAQFPTRWQLSQICSCRPLPEVATNETPDIVEIGLLQSC